MIGEGTPRVFTGTNVAANTEWLETVPAGKVWEVISVTAVIVQGATQTPQPVLVIDDGATVIYESFGASDAQATSTTCRYTWGVGHPLTAKAGATTNVHSVAPLPRSLFLRGGSRIGSNTIGIGANTDWGAPVIFVMQYDNA